MNEIMITIPAEQVAWVKGLAAKILTPRVIYDGEGSTMPDQAFMSMTSNASEILRIMEDWGNE